MRQIKTVFKFEYFGYLKSKPFIALTVILSVLALAVPSIPAVTGMIGAIIGRTSGKSACVADRSGRYANGLIEKYFPDYIVDIVPDAAPALEKLIGGEYEFVLEADGLDYRLHVGSLKLSTFEIAAAAEAMLTEAARADMLREKGFTELDVAGFNGVEPTGEIVTVSGADEGSYFRNTAYAYVLIILLYMTILLYGQFVVTSVVGEKSSRAMELLITSAKPVSLMFGKVVGVAAAGLTQFAIFFACGAVSLAANAMILMNLNSGELAASVPGELASIINAPVSPLIFVYFILFFLLGFLLYAFLFAALASTVSRAEEASSVTVIPMLFIVASFFISLFGLTNSGSGIVTALSYFPFFAPMTMFMRVCMGSAGNAEAVVALIILAASIIFCGYLGAKIYRLGVLMYGKPPKPGEVFRMLLKARVY